MSLRIPAVETALETTFVGRRLVYLPSTESTMDIAREAANGADEGTVVVADEQTAGRGRFGRAWASPAGENLYFTLILRPSPERLRRLSVIAPLAVSTAIEQAVGIGTTIKWPNDVRINERKVAGILIENVFSGAELVSSLVGIGVNVNYDTTQQPDLAGIATSIRNETRRQWPREPLLASILTEFERLYLDADQASVLKRWRDRLDTIGRPVSVTFRGQTLEGTAEDVDEGGNLRVRTPDGSLVAIEAGEVTLRPPQPHG